MFLKCVQLRLTEETFHKVTLNVKGILMGGDLTQNKIERLQKQFKCFIRIK